MLHSRIFTNKEFTERPETSIGKIAGFWEIDEDLADLTVVSVCSRAGLFRLQTRSKLTLALLHERCVLCLITQYVHLVLLSSPDWDLGIASQQWRWWHGQNADRMFWTCHAPSMLCICLPPLTSSQLSNSITDCHCHVPRDGLYELRLDQILE